MSEPATLTPDASGVITIRIAAPVTSSEPRDELVALADCGLEHRAVVALVREGKLRAVKIGRRPYVRRSALLALVDELPAWTPAAKKAKSEPVDTDADIDAAARAAAGRRAKR